MSASVVTIALPIYNSGRYLARCIQTIKAQTWTDFEVVAVLDGCTDDSAAILDQHRDERFRDIDKPENQGHVAALNSIHGIARGEFIARCDSDDAYAPRRLEQQVNFLREHPEIDVVGTRFDYMDVHGKVQQPARRFPLSHERIKRDFQRYTAIGGPTCMYRRERIRAVGNYDPRFNHVEDLALWLACLAAGYRFANLPEVLVHYRVHDAQASQRNYQRQLPQLKEVYDLYGPRIWGRDYRPFGTREPRMTRWKRKLEDLIVRES